jgi:NADPH-dependent 2,4-dienoyl-CoA reductase/sulfur reductase-like enzyme/bacterioferritin-associated ferredoxin
MKSKYHVVIVGSGVGGLTVAQGLAGHGLDTLLIDENAHTGGQLLRKSDKMNKSLWQIEADFMKIKGLSLVQEVLGKRRELTRVNRAQVLGIFEGKKLLINTMPPEDGGKSGKIVEVEAEYIVFATGARERYLPFKGWTLPGVISLGAAQILMKSHGVLPGNKMVIGGSSPLMLVLASEMINNHGRVSALISENPFKKNFSFLPLMKDHWPKAYEGALYIAKMILNRVPMVNGRRIIEAQGNGLFESVVIAKTNPAGDVIEGSETKYQGDVLGIGYGFVPNIELAVQAGCDIEHKRSLGGWVVKVNDSLETSVESIFAVGEINGIAGAKKSYIQGKIAVTSLLSRFGVQLNGSQEKLATEISQLHKLNSQQSTYASFFNTLCQLPSIAYQQIPDDTIICRCENITMNTVKQQVRQGFTTCGGLKKTARCGMGRCQGRTCGMVLQDIITALTAKSPEDIGTSLSRAPVKNVAIKDFLIQTK